MTALPELLWPRSNLDGRPAGPPPLHAIEHVGEDGQLSIDRLRVAGGWLYFTVAEDTGGLASSFVPDPPTFGPGS